MDIEELNKFQIVLLTLLVSFVTSIATGIVTVTLLQQAPPGVTQTINHVVERTIETIVPSATSTVKTTTSQTVVVSEEDLITGAIASALGKTGRVFGGTSTSSPVVGLAAEISPGVLVTDGSGLIDGQQVLVLIGNTQALFNVSQSLDGGVEVLTPVATSTVLGAPFKVADTGAVKLGSTATAILSVANERVAIGSVSAVLQPEAASPGAGLSLQAIETNLDASSVVGAPLIDINGNLIGINTAVSQGLGKGTFISASDIISALAPKATSTPAKTK